MESLFFKKDFILPDIFDIALQPSFYMENTRGTLPNSSMPQGAEDGKCVEFVTRQAICNMGFLWHRHAMMPIVNSKVAKVA